MTNILRTINAVKKKNFNAIRENSLWNVDSEKELRMHRIHSYPAKFPAFITTKALELISAKNKPKKLADVFCGCGTVAFEAKRNNINFWGCDINPVATMIARAKSQKYDTEKLKNYFNLIFIKYLEIGIEKNSYLKANERLKYWYTEKRFKDLKKLKLAIERSTPKNSKYRLFFICAFSNILKASSRWLTKSIKPQIDPKKKRVNVFSVYQKQCKFMISANDENDFDNGAKTEIVNANFLNLSKRPKVDMIITSPPYATSYEYADLHQLSSLWLGFVDDYRELRNGSIGSRYHLSANDQEIKRLNSTGSKIVADLLKKDKQKARSVAKYFLDMQSAAKSCHSMLSKNGKALFVIGNTEFKGVHIDNARHLSEALLQNGFKKVVLNKRKIVGKTLTPYRDSIGKFTTDKKSRKVYAQEFILIGSN